MPQTNLPDSASEGEGRDSRPRRDRDWADFVNNPEANGICRVYGLRFRKEPRSALLRNLRPLRDDRADPVVFATNAVEAGLQ